MMVAAGYISLEFDYITYDFVEILDPWAPCVGDHSYISYSNYVSGTGYTHGADIYNIEYVGP